jgi:hypothetical protein
MSIPTIIMRKQLVAVFALILSIWLLEISHQQVGSIKDGPSWWTHRSLLEMALQVSSTGKELPTSFTNRLLSQRSHRIHDPRKTLNAGDNPVGKC